MCGRFVRKSTLTEISDEFDIYEVQWAWEPSYNIAPGEDIACVINNGKNILAACRWGLVPWWAKDPQIGYKMINARAETLTQKRTFTRPFQEHRCLIVADGFYEWRTVEKRKYPVYVHLRSERPFGLAGLYDRWKSPEGKVITSCTIITTRPNRIIEPIHNRMPVIIPPEDRALWLDKNVHDPQELMPLLQPCKDDEMVAYNVSPKVNSPKFNQPSCIKPVDEAKQAGKQAGMFDS